MTNQTLIQEEFNSHHKLVLKTLEHCQDGLDELIQLACETIEAGAKLIICGNGGSAADAQHIAAEFSGRFRVDRRPLAALALTTDTSALTAIGNDYGFELVFARQLQALSKSQDLLLVISTSGNSINIQEALTKAKDLGIKSVAFLGKDGGACAKLADLSLIVPSQDTARIQEMHILLGHTLCAAVEDFYQNKPLSQD